MTDWRYLRYRPGKAHLWALDQGGLWWSRCGRMCVLDIFDTTYPLAVENGLILKCKQCIQFEVRGKESA